MWKSVANAAINSDIRPIQSVITAAINSFDKGKSYKQANFSAVHYTQRANEKR